MGSSLDARTLGGHPGLYFLDAAHLTGTVSTDRFSAYDDLAAEGQIVAGSTIYTDQNLPAGNAGTITGVEPGLGLDGGGSQGHVKLNIVPGMGITIINGAVAATLGTSVDLNSSEVVNVLPVGNGGTGLSTLPASGQVLLGTGAGYGLALLSAGDGISLTLGSDTISYAVDASVCRTSGNCAPLGIVGSGSTNYLAKFTGSGAIGTSLLFDDGTNVGIGTTSPVSRLGVAGGVAVGAYAGVNAAPSNGLIVSGNVGIGTSSPSDKLHVSGTGIPAILITDADVGGLTAKIDVNQTILRLGRYGVSDILNLDLTNQRVGIGTVSPGAKLSFGTLAGSAAIHLFDSGASSNYGFGIQAAELQAFVPTSSHFSFNSGGALQTSGTNELLRIESGGNVGIGTTTPVSKLDVNGGLAIGSYAGVNAAPSNGLIVSGSVGIGTATPGLLLDLATATSGSFGSQGIRITNSGTDGRTVLRLTNDARTWEIATSGANSDSFVLSDLTGGTAPLQVGAGAPSGSFYVSGSGNVGVGTANPALRLSVSNGSVLVDNGSFYSAKRTDAVVAGMLGIQSDNFTGLKSSGSSFGVRILDSTNNPLVTVLNGGNVGIGATAPGDRLTLDGGNLALLNATTASGKLVFHNVGDTDSDSIYKNGTNQLASDARLVVNQGTVAAPAFAFTADTASGLYLPATSALGLVTAGGERVRIDASGNVGIGTTGPQSKLDVAGGLAIGSYAGVNAAPSNGLIISGRLGIGDTNPGQPLSVAGSITARAASEISVANRGLIVIPQTAGNGEIIRAIDNAGLFLEGMNTSNGIVASRIKLVGNNPNGYITFETNTATVTAVERMRLDPNGYLGLGTSSPTAQLHLKGNLSTALSGTVAVTNGSTAVVGTGTSFTTQLAAGDAIGIAGVAYTVSSIADNTHLTLTSNYAGSTASGLSATKDPNLLAIDNGAGTNALTLTKTGSLGIGTTSPASALSVAANLPSGGAILNLTNTDPTWSQTVGLGYIANTKRLYARGGSAGSAWEFQDPSGATDILYVGMGSAGVAGGTTTRNVGIQTSAPLANFQVNQATTGPGSVTTNGTTTLTGSGTNFTNTFKVGDTITVSGETARTITAIASDTSLTVSVAFATSAAGLTYTLTGGTRLVVQGNGNVGIGVSSPASTLDVSGALKSSGDTNGVAFYIPSGTAMRTTSPAGSVVFADVGTLRIRNGDGALTGGGLAVGNSLLVVDASSGNVGVGTASGLTSKLTFAAATTAAGGILFGSDTNLYRAAADSLRTDDLFTAGSGVVIGAGGSTISRFLSATATWDPPSVATGSVATTTLTVTNAAFGDTAVANLNQALPDGVTLSAAVSAANAVKVTLTNLSGSTQDLSSGTLRADVWQH